MSEIKYTHRAASASALLQLRDTCCARNNVELYERVVRHIEDVEREARVLTARLAATESRSMDALQGRIGEWQRATFPNPKGEFGPTVRHARSEVLELVEICELIDKYSREASAIGEPLHSKLREEAADVFLLLCGVAEIGGFSLRSAAEQKLAINRNRKWGERNAEGFIEHVSDPRTDAGAGRGGEG